LSSAPGGTAARAIRRVARRLERRLFPEAGSAAEHWQRKVMNDAVDRHIAELGPERLTAAEISGDNHAAKPWLSHVSLDFPEFDLCAPLAADQRRFDVVICEQVLEHVVDPCAAARNLHALCAPGGRAVVSTPFMIRVHELPLYGLPDFWRFTPRGLGALLESSGFNQVEVHSWGNRECIVGNMSRWARYRSWMPLHDDPDLPVQVWAYARA
jgi:SAM-dependent methyltransferase